MIHIQPYHFYLDCDDDDDEVQIPYILFSHGRSERWDGREDKSFNTSFFQYRHYLYCSVLIQFSASFVFTSDGVIKTVSLWTSAFYVADHFFVQNRKQNKNRVASAQQLPTEVKGTTLKIASRMLSLCECRYNLQIYLLHIFRLKYLLRFRYFWKYIWISLEFFSKNELRTLQTVVLIWCGKAYIK